MFQDPYLTHRVISIELDEATRRAEQLRRLCEHPGRIRPAGLWVRVRSAVRVRRDRATGPTPVEQGRRGGCEAALGDA